MEQRTRTERLKDEILSRAKQRDHVTFAELSGIDDGPNEEKTFALEPLENLILWSGISEDFGDAVNLLHLENKISFVVVSALIYFVDGKSLRLPIAKKWRAYKNPRWLPVAIRPI